MTALAVVIAQSRLENLRRARAAGAVARVQRTAAAQAARLEDLVFLASHGVSRPAAAARAGFPTVEALDRFCRRMGRHDLIRAMPAQRSAA